MPAPYSDERRREVLAIYEAKGLGAAHRETGIPKYTVRRWAVRAGIDPKLEVQRHVEQTKNATAVFAANAGLRRAERIAAITTRLLDEAETELSRLRQPVHERRVASSGKLVEWDEAEPSAGERKSIATTTAILLDKSQLLAGAATERTEYVRPEEEIAELQRQWRERLERRAS